MVPEGVCVEAFSSRFRITCERRAGSPNVTRPGRTFTTNRCDESESPLCSAVATTRVDRSRARRLPRVALSEPEMSTSSVIFSSSSRALAVRLASRSSRVASSNWLQARSSVTALPRIEVSGVRSS